MAHLIVTTVELGPSEEIAVGVEQGAVYELVGPDGARAVFNDRADADFVGWLTAPPGGLDSPDVRESADLLVEADGGIHGAFYFGRRPVTLEGIIDPTPDPGRDVKTVGATTRVMTAGEVANKRINRLQRASRAMLGNALLKWQSSTGPAVQIGTRRQQPLRITDRLPKRFMLALVAAEPRIVAQVLDVASRALIVNTDTTTALTVTNDGNAPSSPAITVRATGTVTAPLRFVNRATGKTLELAALNLTTNDVLVIDFNARTITLNGTNRYDALSFVASEWWLLEPGDNPISVTVQAGAANGTYEVAWRDSWL